jgi:hypothetical protein
MFSFNFDGSEGLSIIGEVQVRSEQCSDEPERARQRWNE